MRPMEIRPAGRLSGEITLPGDKSISHRAVILGAIAKGETVARGVLDCDDCNYTIGAFRDMGVRFERDGIYTRISGVGLRGLDKPDKPLGVGSSGTSMRILAGMLAGQGFEATIVGDEGLSKRPMGRVIEPLSMMGADIKASAGGFPPLRISPADLRAIDYKLPVASAQVKSAILFAGLYADGKTTVSEKVKSRDHTERMMRYFGAGVDIGPLTASVRPGAELRGRKIEVPGDISSASFFAAGAALIAGSRVSLKGVGVNPTRAGILSVLSRMGARCDVVNGVDAFEPYGDIVASSGDLRGITIEEGEIPGMIDELPVIFVLASLAEGRTVIRGAGELRVKETDRIASMKENLEKMGGRLSIEGDSVVIDGVKRLKGADLRSYGDHRTVMAMTIAALAADGPSSIDDAECVNKSFPEFFRILDTVRC